MKKGETCTGPLRAPDGGEDAGLQCRRYLPTWGGGLGACPPQNLKKLELKYEVFCISRHVYSVENDRVPQQI